MSHTLDISNTLNFSWTTSPEDLKDWDHFLHTNPRGNNLQCSDWLKSYKKYGFSFEVLVVRNEKNEVIGGIGTVLAGFPFFRVLIAPCSPIINKEYEDLFENLLQQFLNRAKQKKVFYCHINLPVLKEENSILKAHCISTSIDLSLFETGTPGNQFPAILSISGFRPVFINYSEGVETYKALFKSFNTNTKRNIKAALKNNLELRFQITEAEVAAAYQMIEHNARVQGYPVRSWKEAKTMVMSLVEKGYCMVPCCYHQGQLKGALIVFDFGRHLTYISGGTLREDQDLKVGHFLHNEMLKQCIQKGYSFYDISVGGSKGVTRFKEGFRAYTTSFIDTRYWILQPFKYSIFLRLNPFIEKNKVFISRILSKLK